MKGCVRVYYTREDKPTTTDHVMFFLNSEIIIAPKSMAKPEAWIQRAIAQSKDKPRFALQEYQGRRMFGKEIVWAAQCVFDRAAWNDRAMVKTVVVPRGDDLVCFEFVIAAVYEKEWQPAIDRFIEKILAGSAKP